MPPEEDAMALIHEIAPDIYRITVYVPDIDLQFSHFLVRDEQPLLFHTGPKGMFPEVSGAVRSLIDLSRLRYISFSHFETDECGALNLWLEQAPEAVAVSGLVGAIVNLNDFAIRPPRVLSKEEVLETGRHRFRFVPTPHVPHGWDAGVLFEETGRTLFCSDLFHQWGEMEPLTESSVLDRAREALLRTESGPLARYIPYTHHTQGVLEELAGLNVRMLAVRELADVWRATLGPSGEANAPSTPARKAEGTLYQRVGGYDVIAAIIDDLMAMQRADPRFSRFLSSRSADSRQRARQLFVDQMCALAGGPCFYIGRDMKTSHAGLGITPSEWNASMEIAAAALQKQGIPQKEREEFLSLFRRYHDDIVEARQAETGGE
jgi:truncated hemoglobin YjbI/glyoxylase-like metal-dependent hydrolase (beta-lactamase superfamily II)